jgi:hypothetical protein
MIPEIPANILREIGAISCSEYIKNTEARPKMATEVPILDSFLYSSSLLMISDG